MSGRAKVPKKTGPAKVQTRESGQQRSGESSSVSLTRVEQHFSGPLPPPQILGLYNEIVPGMAERLLAAFESQQAHRHQLELETVRHGIWRSKNGLWCGLAVALGALLLAGAAIAKDQQVAGAVIGGGTLVGIVTLFVTGQHGQRKEHEGRLGKLTRKQ